MRKALLVPLLLVALIGTALPVGAKEVVGWVENVKIYPGGIRIKAKIDTGAKTSSLSCQCITPVKRNGEDWVSFSVKNSDGDVTMIEKPVLRIAKIRRFFGKSQERFVIKLGICLANVYHEEEVTLMDRSGFNYQMLIGRNFTRGEFLVDPGMTFITRPSCKQAPAK